MESWRKIWREGFSPQMSTKALTALAEALRTDDPRLMQGMNTDPPPLMCLQETPCKGGDAIALAGHLGESLKTVGEVEEYFARACWEADQRLNEPAACRWFLNWFDDTPRDQMRRELLVEVELVIRDRTFAVA